MADPKVPELPEGWEPSPQGQWLVNGDVAASFTYNTLHVTAMHCGAHLPLPVLRALLYAHGLHVVSEADKRVLDACARLNEGELHSMSFDGSNEQDIVAAELARRTP